MADRDACLFVVDKVLLEAEARKQRWSSVAHLNRVNALSAVKSAEHGWLGGSWSVCEILTVLHMDVRLQNVVLSKGHAAAMQYAVLYACGELSRDHLLAYKKGLGFPDAHADLQMDTGSLGQGLSTAYGLACTRPDEQYAVILGDGELQEGQVFEAFMSLAHRPARNLTVFVDLNGFQSDNAVKDIMPIRDLAAVVRGFGLHCIEIDGHDCEAIRRAWEEARRNPERVSVILCRTVKAGGTDLLPATIDAESKLLAQPFHTKVPEWPLYCSLVDSLLRSAGVREAQQQWQQHRRVTLTDTVAAALPNKPAPPPGLGTGKAFGAHLCSLLLNRPSSKLAVLDADLASSCGLKPLIGCQHPRFFEVGVAEQNMCSMAGGMALGGWLPVCNTYGVFFKRAQESVHINQAQHLQALNALRRGERDVSPCRVIYAGHYSGLCYHTDGKSHQSLNDMATMLSMPGLVCIDPVTPQHATEMLDWAVSGGHSHSVYFRLRRTACPEVSVIDQAAAASEVGYSVTQPLLAAPSANRRFFVTMGTVATKLALDALQRAEFKGWGLLVVTALGVEPDLQAWQHVLGSAREGPHTLFTVEDDIAPGSLHTFVSRLVTGLRLRTTLLGHSIGGAWPAPSFRTPQDCLQYFDFTPEALARRLTHVVRSAL